MNTSINLLVIEDKPADFRLIVRHLERHGLAARCHCVASLEELEAAVEQGGWDAVLPDYSVPKLDFQHTLGLLQSRYPDLPLILVSGSVGEERAVELLKLGVWDFVLKDNLTRLIPAIERSLREATDRRERKQAEAALRESEKQFRAMFEVASIGMAQADPQTGQWLRVNQKMCAITGYSADEMVRMHISEITHPEDRQKDRDVFQRVIRGEIPDYRLEKRYLRKDGTIAWVNVNVTVIRDVVGQATHLLAAIEDITERKQREEALVLAKDAAEAANRAKSEFLNNMSHELRTPLTAILGCSELLSTGNLSPAVQGEFLEMIQRSGQGLLGIINDVLDLARIEADRLPLEKTDCALRQILDDVMAMAKITAAKKGLSLQVVHGLPLPATLYTDATRLRQILINLVGNAVKFTERGEVRLTVRCSESGRGTAQMQFAVSDTGIGIPSDRLETIFQPFVQVDGSHTRRYGGTGLGLSICQRLAEMLDGRLDVTSELGRGSTFTLTVDGGPWRGSPGRGASSDQVTGPTIRAEPGEPSPVLQGRVLLVEDEPNMQQVIGYLLRKLKLEVEVAGDGQLACQMVERSRSEGRPYAMILMDLQLPDLDGLAATRWLRAQGWTGPIVALTAHAMVGDRERSLAAGCDDYLSKPITSSELREMLRPYLGQGQS